MIRLEKRKKEREKDQTTDAENDRWVRENVFRVRWCASQEKNSAEEVCMQQGNKSFPLVFNALIDAQKKKKTQQIALQSIKKDE